MDKQFIVTGRVWDNAENGEVIKFRIKLGVFALDIVVNIPEEGKNTAPVYVRYGLTQDLDQPVRVQKKPGKPEATVVQKPRRFSRAPRAA